MSEHTLPEGISVIQHILLTGEILEYRVQSEFPVSTKSTGTNTAVDVAWFKEDSQRYPLFIFEIESQPTNSLVYNPLKVFSKPTASFEKPLFFFHLILTKGFNSERINDLKQHFGSHNYRIYRMSSPEERENFLFDVLSQHRKLTAELNIPHLCDYLLSSDWLGISLDKILNHVETCEFETASGNFLPYIGALSLRHPSGVDQFCRVLKQRYGTAIAYTTPLHYTSWYGKWYAIPIHLGILALRSKSLSEKHHCFSKLKLWQNSSQPTMIGPHFGLSHDYDEFLIRGVGGVLSLIGSLFYDMPVVRLYLAQLLDEIIERTSPIYRLYNYLWLIYLPPMTDEGHELRKKALQYFRDAGCFSRSDFENLPLIVSEEFFPDFTAHQDDLPDYATTVVHGTPVDEQEILRNAILTVSDYRTGDEAGREVIHALTYFAEP